MDADGSDRAVEEAVLATVGAGSTGQVLRDALVRFPSGGRDLRRGSWRLHASKTHPTFTPHLYVLRSLGPTNISLKHLFIEESFGVAARGCNAQEQRGLVDLERDSNADIRALLHLTSRTLLSLSFVCCSADPASSARSIRAIFDGVEFRVLRELCITGDLDTTDGLALPLTQRFAPKLERLQLPSDMLGDTLADDIPACFPRLKHLEVHPLRPGYTVAQHQSLMRIGAAMGVLNSENAIPTAPLAAAARRSIRVVAYVPPGDARREQELRRFEASLARCVRRRMAHAVTVRRIAQQRVPRYEDLALAAKKKWERESCVVGTRLGD